MTSIHSGTIPPGTPSPTKPQSSNESSSERMGFDDEVAAVVSTAIPVKDNTVIEAEKLKYPLEMDRVGGDGRSSSSIPLPSSSSSSSSFASSGNMWWLQVRALLVKNYLVRWRSLGATLMELLTPWAMMLILVWAMTLTDVTDKPARVYASPNVGTLPPTWLTPTLVQSDLLSNFLSTINPNNNNNNDGTNTRHRRTTRATASVPNPISSSSLEEENDTNDFIRDVLQKKVHQDHAFDTNSLPESLSDEWPLTQYFMKLAHASSSPYSSLVSSSSSSSKDEGRRHLQTEEEDGVDDDFLGSGGAILGDGEEALAAVNDLMNEVNRLLKGPLPVPTLGQFVGASVAIRSVFDTTSIDQIYREFSIWRMWENLLELGTLHISPDTGIGPELVTYLNATYGSTLLDNLPIRLHATESTGIKYINEHLDTERAWALIVLAPKNGDSSRLKKNEAVLVPDDMTFTIRMNYTTLPNTNQITDFVSVGLNKQYQNYYRSGFMTLQRTLNELAFSRSYQATTTTTNNNNVNTNDMFSNESDPSTTTTSDDSQCAAIANGTFNIWSMPMPTPAYSQNSFFAVVGYLLGLTIAMAFLYPVSRLIKLLVEEKETRMKETLLILGVRPFAHWISWVITSAVVFFIIDVLVTVTLSSNVLKFSSPAYLFVYISLFSSASAGFSFFLAAFFSRAKLAAIVGPVALFATLLPRWIFFGTNRYEATAQKMWASLLPCTAFAFGADIIADYEYAEQGVQSYNASEGEYSFNTTLGFLFFDTLLYFTLAWYLELVLPRQYGVAEKWYFLFTPTYWLGSRRCCQSKQQHGYEMSSVVSNSDASSESADGESGDNFEVVTESSGLLPRVRIQNLIKRYNKKPHVPPAVNNLNLSLYESQITCLLGHNGAGKSSTISVLTGLFPPTSGDCYIYGKSITNQLAEARASMGICPQHNVLFDGLTVLEHLRFFERIKGNRKTARASAVERSREVGLGDFFHTASRALSGGNKRKLSVAIAMCGDPDFLMLDEPTSGMDPYSRRATWELLRKKRIGRVILLTTHFMDEAELLADRIAVMKEGKLQCCGSLLFLKNRFGLGYTMTVVLDVNKAPSDASGVHGSESLENVSDDKITDLSLDNSEVESGRRPISLHTNIGAIDDGAAARITAFLKNFIPGTELVRTSARELMYRFPPGTEDLFPPAFDAIEKERGSLGIGAYGISNTSLEEVFLRLANDEELQDIPSGGQGADALVASNDRLVPVETGIPLSAPSGLSDKSQNNASPISTTNLSQVMASATAPPLDVDPIEGLDTSELNHMSPMSQIGLLFWKRFSIQKRDLKGAFFMIIVPVLLIALVLLILRLDIVLAGPAIQLSPNLYRKLPSGTSGARTNVPIARGASTTLSGNETSIASLVAALQSEYNHIDAWSSPTNSSMQLSQYLLDSYNEHNRSLRYGAIVIDDEIEMTLTVDWDALTLLIENMTDFGLLSQNGTFDIGNLFGTDFPLELLLPLLPENSTEVAVPIPTPVSIMHNATSPHALASFNQAYMDYMYKTCFSSPTAQLTAINHPLPLTPQQSIEIRTILSGLASLFLLIPYCYIPAAFIVFLVKERVSKSKHLQLVSGVNMSAYWIATYLWDMCLYLVLTGFIMAVFAIYGTDSAQVFVGSAQSFFCTLALTFGYGLSSLPFAYLFSRNFSNHSTAQISVMGIFFITGFVAVNAYFILSSLENTQHIAKALQPLFRIWPPYLVGDGFLRLSASFWEREVLGSDANPFDWDICGYTIMLLYMLSVPYFLLVLMLEYSSDGGSGGLLGRTLRSLRHTVDRAILKWNGVKLAPDGRFLLDDGLDELTLVDGSTSGDGNIEDDADVSNEAIYVIDNEEELKRSAPVLLSKMWKIYPPSTGLFGSLFGWIRFICCFCCRLCSRKQTAPEDDEADNSKLPKRAVRGLTIAVGHGETYGLLGVNGSGKSTTLGVLTGDITPTSGSAYVAGSDVTGLTPGGVASARQHIGFCPQVDPLLNLMTGRETLTMFGRLRGLPREVLSEAVNKLMDALTLTPHADKVAESYSGGNKRKLSLGVALIGNPKVLFIDEASSGMDPAARRKMWRLISKFSERRSVILTTHSMEEAEALCTRVGIMISGKLRCLGSVQHLKSTFLDGYTVDVNCTSDATTDVVDYVEQTILKETLVGSQLTERHGRFMKFDIKTMSSSSTGETRGLGGTFRALEALKRDPDNKIEDYSISQCSLEQVFISLAKAGSTSERRRQQLEQQTDSSIHQH